MSPLPHYYSSLGPFRKVFLQGTPILTYHHVGPRRRGARLKGLYLSPRLFDRQLTELRSAGFSSTSLNTLVNPLSGVQHVFLTFDDGFRDVFDHGLPVLRTRGFCGMLYLVSDLVGQTNVWQQRAGDIAEPLMDEAAVRDWLGAGQQIGSHTRTHPRLTQLTPAAAREEIFASKKALEDRFGLPIDHFCYPYGDFNPAVRDLVGEAGYKTACTTQTGINPSGAPLLELKRVTARYPSRNLKAIWTRLRLWAGGD